MFEIKKNKKNKSAVILNPERSEWVSRSHVTSVEPVVNDGAKKKRYSAKRDLYARSPKGSRLKMTEKVLSLSGASSEPIVLYNKEVSSLGKPIGLNRGSCIMKKS